MRARYRLSVSTRLTLWYGFTLAVLLSLFAAFCYASFHQGLHRDFDFHLAHETRVVQPHVEIRSDGPAPGDVDRLESVAIHTGGVLGTYVRLLDAAGQERYRSPNFEEQPPLPLHLPAVGQFQTRSVTWRGLPARTAYTPLQYDGHLVGWLEVTGFEWSLHQELHRLGQTLALGIVLSLVLALVGGFLLARRALRPVAALTESAARIGETALGARLPADFGVRDELSDLAETFNAMLARLEASVERERRFTTNAAHELMTPVATLKSEAEVSLRRERTPEAYRTALATVLDVAGEMEAVVEGLLALARTEEATDARLERVDLAMLAQRHVERCRSRADERGVELMLKVEPGVFVKGAPALLGQVIDNLLDNAVKYTPTGGRVSVEVRGDERMSLLLVEDSGIGFSPAVADRLFDRFYRADVQGVQEERGSGLGLSIAHTLVARSGGTLRAQSAGEGLGSRFEAAFPQG
jgi:signal transduction histidine kinase